MLASECHAQQSAGECAVWVKSLARIDFGRRVRVSKYMSSECIIEILCSTTLRVCAHCVSKSTYHELQTHGDAQLYERTELQELSCQTAQILNYCMYTPDQHVKQRCLTCQSKCPEQTKRGTNKEPCLRCRHLPRVDASTSRSRLLPRKQCLL